MELGPAYHNAGRGSSSQIEGQEENNEDFLKNRTKSLVSNFGTGDSRLTNL